MEDKQDNQILDLIFMFVLALIMNFDPFLFLFLFSFLVTLKRLLFLLKPFIKKAWRRYKTLKKMTIFKLNRDGIIHVHKHPYKYISKYEVKSRGVAVLFNFSGFFIV